MIMTSSDKCALFKKCTDGFLSIIGMPIRVQNEPHLVIYKTLVSFRASGLLSRCAIFRLAYLWSLVTNS